jgi:hypothetical protein
MVFFLCHNDPVKCSEVIGNFNWLGGGGSSFVTELRIQASKQVDCALSVVKFFENVQNC